MALDSQSVPPTDPGRYGDVVLQPNWSERVVVVVAASMAVMIVAITAVLMGMG